MTTHRFPSPDFPAFPEISIDVPDDWSADAAPSVTMVLAGPESSRGFRTNVTVRVDRTVGSADLASVGQASTTALSSEPNYLVRGDELVEIDGRSALLRVHTFDPVAADGATVFQALCLMVVPTPNPAFADVVTIVATCLAAEAGQYGELFRQIVESARIVPAA